MKVDDECERALENKLVRDSVTGLWVWFVIGFTVYLATTLLRDERKAGLANDVKCAEIIAAAIREAKPAPVVPHVPPDPWTAKPPAIHTFPAPTTVTLPSAMPSWYVPVPALETTTTAEDCGWAERGAK